MDHSLGITSVAEHICKLGGGGVIKIKIILYIILYIEREQLVQRYIEIESPMYNMLLHVPLLLKNIATYFFFFPSSLTCSEIQYNIYQCIEGLNGLSE